MVRGAHRMNALLRISRNMAIVEHDGGLTLINPIRLTAEGERELAELGEIRHLLRLGPFHGIDDPYYVDTFGAKLWAQPGGRAYRKPPITVQLVAGGALPFPDADLVPFEHTKQPESVLLLERGDGLLLTCDSIQHYGDYRHNSLPLKVAMPFMGFPRRTVIGPIWLKYMASNRAALKPDFERLLGLDFDNLLGGHGSFLAHGAKDAVRAAIRRTFG